MHPHSGTVAGESESSSPCEDMTEGLSDSPLGLTISTELAIKRNRGCMPKHEGDDLVEGPVRPETTIALTHTTRFFSPDYRCQAARSDWYTPPRNNS